MLRTPTPYLLVLVATTGTVLQQSAFHAGALQASVPTMIVLEPVVAVLLGILVLGEQLTVHGPAVMVCRWRWPRWSPAPSRWVATAGLSTRSWPTDTAEEPDLAL